MKLTKEKKKQKKSRATSSTSLLSCVVLHGLINCFAFGSSLSDMHMVQASVVRTSHTRPSAVSACSLILLLLLLYTHKVASVSSRQPALALAWDHSFAVDTNTRTHTCAHYSYNSIHTQAALLSACGGARHPASASPTCRDAPSATEGDPDSDPARATGTGPARARRPANAHARRGGCCYPRRTPHHRPRYRAGRGRRTRPSRAGTAPPGLGTAAAAPAPAPAGRRPARA